MPIVVTFVRMQNQAGADGSMPIWNAPEIVADYRARNYLLPAELACLGEVWARSKGGAVLDLGVGTGRTVPFLRPLAGRYVGVDFAAEMVSACRARFPDVDLRQGDARDLAAFADHEFDLVLFSFNGIDYMPPEDRPRALSEVFRVLRPGGVFVFSTHNLNALDRSAIGRFRLPPIVWTPRPLRLAARLARLAASALRAWRNHHRLAREVRQTEEWAFVNDGAHASSLLTCYVRPAAQLEALRAAGFSGDIAVYGQDGLPAKVDARDTFLHIVAARPAG
jgi:SAM-dependent methyltransferase